jgi:hypothetical protein
METYWADAEIVGYIVTEYSGAERTDQYFVEDIQDDKYMTWTNAEVSEALDCINKFGDYYWFDPTSNCSVKYQAMVKGF